MTRKLRAGWLVIPLVVAALALLVALTHTSTPSPQTKQVASVSVDKPADFTPDDCLKRGMDMSSGDAAIGVPDVPDKTLPATQAERIIQMSGIGDSFPSAKDSISFSADNQTWVDVIDDQGVAARFTFDWTPVAGWSLSTLSFCSGKL